METSTESLAFRLSDAPPSPNVVYITQKTPGGEYAEQSPKPEIPLVKDDTDESVAILFQSQFGNYHRFVSDGNYWLHWNGRLWTRDSKAQSVHEDLHNLRALLTLQRIGEPDKVTDSIIIRLSNSGSKRSIVSYLQNCPRLVAYQHELDSDPNIVVFENCAYNTSRGEFIRYENEIIGLLQTKCMPVYHNEQAGCPRWLEFLHTIFRGDMELIAFVQKAAALSLSGTVIEELLFFAHGSGRNGKTTFFAVLEKIFGPYHVSIDSSVLLSSALDRSDRNLNIKAGLKGVRFATVNEIAEKSSFNDKEIKHLASRDRITARRLYENHFEFEPSHKLWIRSNHKPSFNISDGGLRRRIILIPFHHLIPEHDVVERFEDELLKEKSGILNWLLEGWQAYLNDGLEVPAACRVEMDAYMRENDHLADFIDECCLVKPEGRTLLKDFSEAYNQWAQNTGCEGASSAKLSPRLAAKNYTVKNHTGNRLTVFGLALSAAEPPEQSKPGPAKRQI